MIETARSVLNRFIPDIYLYSDVYKAARISNKEIMCDRWSMVCRSKLEKLENNSRNNYSSGSSLLVHYRKTNPEPYLMTGKQLYAFLLPFDLVDGTGSSMVDKSSACGAAGASYGNAAAGRTVRGALNLKSH
jgi:hypothetical protein